MIVPPILPVADRLTAIVICRTKKSRSRLLTLLGEQYPQIHVVGDTNSVDSAWELLRSFYPDILFLDSHVSDSESLHLTNSVLEQNSLVIYVESDGRFQVKLNAVESRLKLSEPSDLQELLDRFISFRTEQHALSRSLSAFQNMLVDLTCYVQNSVPVQRIVLSTEQGFVIEETDNIVRLQSDNNYVTVVRNGLKNIVLSKSLKDFEAILDPERFVRVHNSHIINMDYLKEFENRQGGYVVLRDGSRVPVSRRRHTLLMEKIKKFACV